MFYYQIIQQAEISIDTNLKRGKKCLKRRIPGKIRNTKVVVAVDCGFSILLLWRA